MKAIVKKKRFPHLFQLLGLIFIRPDSMADLRVIPGDFVICRTNEDPSSSFLFRVGLSLDSFFSGIDCEVLVEDIYDLNNSVEINRIEERELPIIRKLFIENAAMQKIDNNMIANIKNYLIQRRFPINDKGYVIVGTQVFFFRKVKHPGVIIDSSEVVCLQTFLDEEIEKLKQENRDLKRQILEIEKSTMKVDKLCYEKSKEMETYFANLERQIAERKEVIRCKQGEISRLKQEIDEIEQRIDAKRREEELKKFDEEQLRKLIKSTRGK